MNSPPPRKRRRKCRQAESNVFEDFENSYGVRCFVETKAVKKMRLNLYRMVNDHGGYRNVIKRITDDAMGYYNSHADRRLVTSDRKQICTCPAIGCIVLALHICQKYKYQDDPERIRELISTVADVDGGFDRFMTFLDPLSFTFEVDQILYPTKPTEDISSLCEKHLFGLQYFLQYGNNIQMPMQFSEFDFVGHDGTNAFKTYTSEVDMVNCPVLNCRGSTPLLLACHSLEPMSVLLLLRYGADPLRPGQIHHIVGLQFQHPLYVLVTKLNASVFWRAHNSGMEQDLHDRFVSRQDEQDMNLRQCLRFLGRAMTSLPITTKSQSSTMVKPLFQLHKHFHDLLPKNRTSEPAELRQWCRWNIRKVLQDCGKLPVGICQLPLPSLLKNYVDLLMD